MFSISLFGQTKTDEGKGKVSYISSQNVYVKFESTEKIEVGDTLLINRNGQLIPALVVNSKSSISCVCTPLISGRINVADEVILQIKHSDPALPQEDEVAAGALVEADIEDQPLGTEDPSVGQMDTKGPRSAFKQNITGRVSAASFNTFANSRDYNRFRYTFYFRGDHLGNTGLSVESYITFRHTLGEWEEVKENVSSALKLYTLALKYDFGKASRVIAGRHINHNISSIGAIDGLQFDQGLGNFTIGGFVGSRPDHTDYSLNFDLFQYGVYLGYGFKSEGRYMQNTLAYIEQRNSSNIDRRFIYFQHSSSLARNLFLFGSMEVSLYENINNDPKTTVDLNNLYASLRYRVSRKLNLMVSYDNRKNIHYYETFKNFIDQLIDEETRQGVRFHGNYRISKNIVWGLNTGWRFQKSDKNLSRNLNSYLTFNRIPGVNVRTTLTVNFLRTNYLDSKIFGIRISKDIVQRKLYGDIRYRWVDYDYLNYETASSQNIVGANLSWNIIKRLSLYANYEITFDSHDIHYHQFYTRIVQRF